MVDNFIGRSKLIYLPPAANGGDAALFQINRAAGGFKGENGVGADARDGVVGGSQFDPRGWPGANEIRRFKQFIFLGRRGRLG